jgi:hypothetical protein
MIRLVALCVGVLLATGWTQVAEVALIRPCVRPGDQYGPHHEAITGDYQSRGVSPGGGKFVTIMPVDSITAPVSLSVTDKIFDIAGILAIGTEITLVSYVRNSVAGTQPPYSCIELAH